MASNNEGLDVRGEVVDMLIQKIAADCNPSVTMMNLVEELLTPDDVPACVELDGRGEDRQVPRATPCSAG